MAKKPPLFNLGGSLETIVSIGLALALGILVGYGWRDHLSQQRRTKYLLERERRNATKAAARDSR